MLRRIFIVSLVIVNTLWASFVAAQQASEGEFLQPSNGETFAGNLLFFVQASNGQGINSVAIRFPQTGSQLLVCRTSTACGNTEFTGLLSGVNPRNLGLSEGIIDVELVVNDSSGQSSVVDELAVNWVLPEITNVSGERSEDGTELTVSWPANSDFFRFNIYLAEESGVSPSSVRSLEGGQARLIRRNSPEVFEDLTPAQTYYILVTGVDASGESGFSEVVEVEGLNVPPEAVDDAFTIDEDTISTFDVVENDINENEDILTLVSVSSEDADVSVLSATQVSYTPPENFSGEDAFSYIVEDEDGEQSTANVIVTVTEVNDDPVAVADVAETFEDEPVLINVLANDTDVESVELSILQVTQPSNGAAEIVGTNVQYAPEIGFFGTDSFSYTVTDDSGGEGTAQVDVVVVEINAPPIAQNDSANTVEGETISIDVLSNDSDPDGDTLTVISASAQNGIATIQGEAIEYSPNDGFFGIDTLSYTISDGSETAEATVSIDVVAAVNQAPSANSDVGTLEEDSSLVIDVLINDLDPDGDDLSITLASASNGNVSIQDQNISYQPNANFNGSDSINYTISDGELTDSSSVSITVTPVNDLPELTDDAASTDIDATITIDVLANDEDVDGDSLTIVTAEVLTGTGSVSIVNNRLVYMSGSLVETVTLTYSAVDVTEEEVAAATVTINVTIPPVVTNNDLYTVTDSASLNISAIHGVLSNDEIQDGTLSLISPPSFDDSFSINADGSFNYSHDGTTAESDSFVYQVSGDTISQSTATIHIVESNALPAICTIPAAHARVNETYNQTINLLDEDGVSGSTFSFSDVPPWLSAIDNGDGTASLSGTPTAFDIGQGQIAVSAFDEDGAQDSIRFNYVVSDNTLGFNSSFNSAVLDFDSDSHFVRDMARDRNGNMIVVGGDSNYRFIVGRITPEGVLDDNFAVDSDVDNDGVGDAGLTTLFDGATGSTIASVVRVLDNNKIVVAGTLNDSGSDIAIAVLNNDGSLDTNFATNGMLTDDPTSTSSVEVADIEIINNKYVTVIGHYFNDTTEAYNFFATQYDFNGNLNLNFGINGLFSTELSLDYFAAATLQDREGNIYILGTKFDGSLDNMAIARITHDGVLDLSFDGDGFFTFSDSENVNMNDFSYDGDGGFIVAGSLGEDIVAARFKPTFDSETSYDSLTFDNAFSSGNGFLRIDNSSSVDRVTKIVPDQLGNYYLLGQKVTGTTTRTRVVKMIYTGDLDITYGTGGIRDSDSILPDGDANTAVAGVLNPYGQLMIAETSKDGSMNNAVFVVQYSEQGIIADYGSCDLVAPCVSNGSTSDELNTLLVSDSGAVIAVGDSSPLVGYNFISIAKFNDDFVFDQSYGEDGTGLTFVGVDGRDLFTHSAALGNEDELVVLAESIVSSASSLLVAKFTSDGQLDATFGINGVEDFSESIDGIPFSIQFTQGDSRILMGNLVDESTFEIIQLLSDGSLDTSFGTSGAVDISTSTFEPVQITTNSQDEIFILGRVFIDSPSREIIALMKLDSTGAIDTSFGVSGMLTVDLGAANDLFVVEMAVVNNNFYIATIDNITSVVQIVALTSSGALDTTFDVNGDSDGVLDLGVHSEVIGITSDGNGDLIIGLDVLVQGTLVDEVVRVDRQGRLDGRFLNGGRGPIIGRPNSWGGYQDMIALPDGELVFGGSQLADFAIAITDQAGAVENTQKDLRIDFGFGDRANAAGLDFASKLVTAGAFYDASQGVFDLAIRRIPTDGAVGSINSYIDSQSLDEQLTSLTVSPDSKVTAFGVSQDVSVLDNTATVGVRRIDPNFNEDESFGGRTDVDLGGTNSIDRISDQIILDDGSILVVGSIESFASIAKFDNTGVLDSSFANSGVLTLSTDADAHLESIALDGNGDLIAAGYMYESVSEHDRDMLFVKLDSDGLVNTSIGTNGIVTFDFEGDDIANQIAIGPDGAAYVVGESVSDSSHSTVVVKLTPQGTLDPNFGEGGQLLSPDEGSGDAIIFDNYGGFWIARVSADNQIEVVRFNAGGEVGQTFAADGPGIINIITDMEIDSLGNLYVVGNAQIPTNSGNLWDYFSLRFPLAVGRLTTFEDEEAEVVVAF